MHLHGAQLRLGYRKTSTSCIPAVAVPTAPALHRPCAQLSRNVLVRSSKATSLGWDDLANALPRANPEKRVLQDINFFQLVRECPDWETLQRMEEDLRERYDRQPSLAMAVLLRTSEVVDVGALSEAQRREVARVLNSSVVPCIIKKGIYSYRPSSLPPLLAALAALQYTNARLNAVLLKLLESAVDSLLLSQLCSALCSAAALEFKMSPELLDKVVARLEYTLKFCTAEDVGNLATALAPYSKLPPSAGLSFSSQLAARSQPFLEELSGEQLVDLLVLLVRHDFPLTSTWVTTFQTALVASLPGLTRPRSYASLLFSLAKGSLAISESFLAALLGRLTAPAMPGAVRASSSSSSSSSLLGRMRAGDLAVVAAVLSIYGYTPGPEWCGRYVEALERRVGDMEAKQVVTVIDTCAELGIALPGDLMDELLAVSEGGLEALGAGRLVQLVSALEAASHRPDGPWMKQLTKALLGIAGRCSAAELADVVAVLSYAPYAYPHNGEGTAAVLAAVKARAVELKGLDSATRGSVLESLKHLKHPEAAKYADSLAPEPPPPQAQAPVAAKRFTATGPTATTTTTATSGRTATNTAAAAAPAARPSAVTAAVPTAPAPAVPAAAATAAATAVRWSSKTVAATTAVAAAAAAPPPASRAMQPSQSQQQMVGSTRTFGRRRSFDDDEEEGEEELQEEEDEEEVRRPAGPLPRRAAAASPPPPSSPPPSQSSPHAGSAGYGLSDGGFVASTRTSRRRW